MIWKRWEFLYSSAFENLVILRNLDFFYSDNFGDMKFEKFENFCTLVLLMLKEFWESWEFSYSNNFGIIEFEKVENFCTRVFLII